MVMVQVGEQKYYMDGYLQKNLDTAKQLIKKDWDMMFIVDGYEGCQPAGSKVLMANGNFKNIEQIKEGDLILSPQWDGTHIFAKVTKTFSWFSKENYDIISLNHKQKKLYTCSYNHIIPLNYKYKPRRKNKRFKEDMYWGIKEMTAKEYAKKARSVKQNLTTPLSFPIERFNNRKNCFIDGYVLGFFIGDGHFTQSIGITSGDEICIKEIMKFYEVKRIEKKQGTYAKTYYFSKIGKLAKDLKKLGLKDKRSGTKFIPKAALLSDLNYRKRLLAGLIDSDGYLSKEGAYSITTKSPQLAKDIYFLVRSLGGRGNIHKIKKGIKKTGFISDYYNVSFYLGNIYLPVLLKRKQRKEPFFYLSANRIAIDAKKAPPSQVYGFEIDSPSKWYITEDFVITHNTGKSTLAMQIAKYCDPTFNLSRICFNSNTFVKAIGKAEKYQAVVYDEAYGGLNSRAVLSETNRALVKMLTEIRQKNLFVIIVAPCFFEIDKYVAIWRSRALIHVYTGEGFKRGRFMFYSPQKKKALYMNGKRYFSYSKPDPDFIGSFTNTYVVDEKEYRKRKLHAVDDRETLLKAKFKKQRDALLLILMDKGIPIREISILMEEKAGVKMSVASLEWIISTLLKKKREKSKKLE